MWWVIKSLLLECSFYKESPLYTPCHSPPAAPWLPPPLLRSPFFPPPKLGGWQEAGSVSGGEVRVGKWGPVPVEKIKAAVINNAGSVSLKMVCGRPGKIAMVWRGKCTVQAGDGSEEGRI